MGPRTQGRPSLQKEGVLNCSIESMKHVNAQRVRGVRQKVATSHTVGRGKR